MPLFICLLCFVFVSLKKVHQSNTKCNEVEKKQGSTTFLNNFTFFSFEQLFKRNYVEDRNDETALNDLLNITRDPN